MAVHKYIAVYCVLSKVMQEFEQKFGSGSKVFDIRGDARKVCSKLRLLTIFNEYMPV